MIYLLSHGRHEYDRMGKTFDGCSLMAGESQ